MIKHHSDIAKKNWSFKWFSPQEIACRKTGTVLITVESMAAISKLEAIRTATGAPIMINSGYRSPSHNSAIGGAKNSLHMRGVAFDVSMGNHDPVDFERAARDAGFTGFGYYPDQGFIHIDTGPIRTWGKPFPARASRFVKEPKRQTAGRDVAESVPIAASVGAAVEVALREVAPNFAPDWQGYVFGAAAVVGLGLALWRIMKRYREPNGVPQ